MVMNFEDSPMKHRLPICEDPEIDDFEIGN